MAMIFAGLFTVIWWLIKRDRIKLAGETAAQWKRIDAIRTSLDEARTELRILNEKVEYHDALPDKLETLEEKIEAKLDKLAERLERAVERMMIRSGAYLVDPTKG